MITVIAVRAKDWAYYGQQTDRTQEFSLIVGWVVGVLIREDDEILVISQNFFPVEDQVRYTSVIQKREVIQEVRFQVKEEDNATDETDGRQGETNGESRQQGQGCCCVQEVRQADE